MPRPMKRYTVTTDEKRATLILAGWTEHEGRWSPPGITGAPRSRPVPSGGYSMEYAWTKWRKASGAED